jgi:hypothetical protein
MTVCLVQYRLSRFRRLPEHSGEALAASAAKFGHNLRLRLIRLVLALQNFFLGGKVFN